MDEQTVRTQAKRHGYKLRKRGEEYWLLKGGSATSGDLEATAAWLAMLESDRPIEMRTACGMLLWRSDKKPRGWRP
jgi:hypothetical protein